MAGFAHDVAGGDGTLVVPALKSPDYVHGVSGWAIFRNGSVEFNSGTFRGTVTAGTFEGDNFAITNKGAFFYDGPPGANNLAFSDVPGNISVTDPYGNEALPGRTTYNTFVSPYQALSQVQDGWTVWESAGTVQTGWTATGTTVTFSASTVAIQSAGGISLTTSGGDPIAISGGSLTAGGWQSLGALAAGSGYTANVGRYQFLPDGRYEVDIVLTAGGATVAGNYAFAAALPAAPLVTRVYDLGFQGVTLAAGTTNPSVVVGSTVSVNLPVLPSGTRLSCTQRFPVN